MSKKDYIKTVYALAQSLRAGADPRCVKIVAEHLAQMFQEDSPRFNRARFLEAVEAVYHTHT